MSEFSRETLLNIIETDHVQCGEASALARMALAAMDSSESVELPLDYLQGHKDGLEWASQLAEANHPETGDWLYDDPIELAKAIRKGPDMPPAQPVAGSEPVFTLEVARADYKGQKLGNHFGFITLDAARELKEGNYQLYTAQPAPEYPETLPCPVLLEPGLRFGKGIKTSTMLAALARRDVHESDMAALSPEERVEFQARIEDFKALIAQPAPVVLDGYVMVPKEATLEMIKSGASAASNGMLIPGIYKAMLAAADCSIPMISDRWIPVSEQMPEVGDIVLTAMGGAVNVGEMECSAANCRFFTSVISGRELPATHWMPLPAGPKEDINALIPLVSRNEQEGK